MLKSVLGIATPDQEPPSLLLSALKHSDRQAKEAIVTRAGVRRIVVGPNALVVGTMAGTHVKAKAWMRRITLVVKCQGQEVKTRRCKRLLKRIN